MDRAGWHTTSKLEMPTNIKPIFLPSRSPELNPVENIWQYMRANWLSNRFFDNYNTIIEAISRPGTNSVQRRVGLTHGGIPLKVKF
jgi:transposase